MADQLATDEGCVDALLVVWTKQLDAMINDVSTALATIHDDWKAAQGPLLTDAHWATPLMARYAKAAAALEQMQEVWQRHHQQTAYQRQQLRERRIAKDLERIRDREA